MNSEWFFVKNKSDEEWIILMTTRTVEIIWDTGDIDQREILPRKVKIPRGIDLTNDAISDWLTSEYDWTVLDWWVSKESL